MTSNTIYLITGANRGIGLALTAALLLRANTTVIATVRSADTSLSALTSLPTAEGSALITGLLSSSSSTESSNDAASLIRYLVSDHGITHIDTVISNAGTSSFASILTVSKAELDDALGTNTLLPIALFQASHALLAKSKSPKFILMSSFLGSIGAMEPLPCLAYGISKAGANYFVKKVHLEFEEIVAVALHPGWVKTENGQNFADAVGAAEPPMTVEETVEKVLVQIDAATRETASGKFLSFDGNVIPW